MKNARDKRDEARKQLDDGIDPAETRKEAKRAIKAKADNAFEALAREWLGNIRHKWTEEHHTYTLRRFEAYATGQAGTIGKAGNPGRANAERTTGKA